MLMVELIEKKRDGGELSRDEIDFLIREYVSGTIPDYQMSSMLMAIYFRGMTDAETTSLTIAMAESGDTLDLSPISGVKADKHSTGGVGDKTTLILCPMVACLGIKMAKMSGRGLGHTGGTIDKLDSFKGFSTNLSPDKFFSCVNEVGFSIVSQTANLTPADKLLYALRDVTGTVPSKPLLVSSVMSKKIAAGADIIVLDVKCGSGAFMKTTKDSLDLARSMVQTGVLAGRKTVAVVTDMDEPLGAAVGNALEIKESIGVLKGEVSGNLTELCLTLGSCIALESGLFSSETEARDALAETIRSGDALRKFAEFVSAQGGDTNDVFDPSRLPEAPVKHNVICDSTGFISAIAADNIGRVCMHLGGGRASKESIIDLSVGVILKKKRGDFATPGDVLTEIHAASRESAIEAELLLRSCYSFSDEKPEKTAFIKGIVRAE